MESINIISNPNIVDHEFLSTQNKTTVSFFKLGLRLHNSGIRIQLINQDKNYIYFRLINLINGFKSPITELTYKELNNMDFLLYKGLIDLV